MDNTSETSRDRIGVRCGPWQLAAWGMIGVIVGLLMYAGMMYLRSEAFIPFWGKVLRIACVSGASMLPLLLLLLIRRVRHTRSRRLVGCIAVATSLAIAGAWAGFTQWFSPPLLGASAYMAASAEARARLEKVGEQYGELATPIRAAGGLGARSIKSLADIENRIVVISKVRAECDRLSDEVAGFPGELAAAFRKRGIPTWRCKPWLNAFAGTDGRQLEIYRRLLINDAQTFELYEERMSILRREYGRWHITEVEVLWEDQAAADRIDRITEEINQLLRDNQWILDNPGLVNPR